MMNTFCSLIFSVLFSFLENLECSIDRIRIFAGCTWARFIWSILNNFSKLKICAFLLNLTCYFLGRTTILSLPLGRMYRVPSAKKVCSH